MKTRELKKLIDTAAGRLPAELVIRGAKIVDVYGSNIIEGDIAVSGGLIAGIGDYEGKEIVDAKGLYAAPGFIDSHIHIESSYVSPEEIGKLIVPRGTTTIIADPHEIVNVCGITGFNYMLDAAEKTALDIKFMLPSCVPATPFENSGAVIDEYVVKKHIGNNRITGLGEFMDFPSVIGAKGSSLKKIIAARNAGKIIDGHCPAVTGKDLCAYASAMICTDHECTTVEDMLARISNGIYVLLRQGSACHDLRSLLPGVTPENSRRCLLCSDDRQARTMLELGHIDNHLRICIQEGLDPITAIRMASLNASECYRLNDRGAIAPGLRADIVLLEDLSEFSVRRVYIKGVEAARDGEYMLPVTRHRIESVTGSFNVKGFTEEKLTMTLKTGRVHVIGVSPGSVVTKKLIRSVKRDEKENFVFDPLSDIAKIAVVERHKGTGNVALGLIEGYGIKAGALAISIAHDAHNIIVVGTNDGDMAYAIKALIAQGGGIVLALGQKTLECMPMPIGGIMSDKSGQWVDEKLRKLHEIARTKLGINADVEPVMLLCFMSLMVIPEVKLTDMGLFDLEKLDFIDINAD